MRSQMCRVVCDGTQHRVVVYNGLLWSVILGSGV